MKEKKVAINIYRNFDFSFSAKNFPSYKLIRIFNNRKRKQTNKNLGVCTERSLGAADCVGVSTMVALAPKEILSLMRGSGILTTEMIIGDYITSDTSKYLAKTATFFQ